MSLKLGNIAPNFTADTTQGMINFYEWMNDSWTILLSHPKDFSQVCSSELVWLSQNLDLFTSRNIKIISLSVDKLIQHGKWLEDIKNSFGVVVKTPLISDKNMRIAKLYSMIYAVNDSSTEASNSTARSTYIISPDKKIQAMFTYPVNTGRNFVEVVRLLDSLFVTNNTELSTPANWKSGDKCIQQNDKKISAQGAKSASYSNSSNDSSPHFASASVA